jgi:hypothetical protein
LDDVSVVALGTFTYVLQVTDSPLGQGGDLVERGGLIAVGVLLCLNVVVQILNQVLPLIATPKKVDANGKPSDASIRFRADLLRQVALVEQMARQVGELHKWHSDEFESAIDELRQEIAALKQRPP